MLVDDERRIPASDRNQSARATSKER
jgi:hypothetical protein